jgi:hypothetical protein
MRISHIHRIIFVSNPKTGSHTGFKLMEQNFNGKPYGSFHNVKVPDQFKNYSAFTFVRNPYERAVSIWNSVFNFIKDPAEVPNRDRRNYLKAIGSDNFRDFCIWIQDWPNLNHIHEATKPQFAHLHKCNVPLCYVRTENMLEDLNLFLIDKGIEPLDSVPHELKRPHKTFQELGDQDCLNAINIWAKDDFKCGYEKCLNF